MIRGICTCRVVVFTVRRCLPAESAMPILQLPDLLPNAVARLVIRALPRCRRVWFDADPFNPMGRWGNNPRGLAWDVV